VELIITGIIASSMAVGATLAIAGVGETMSQRTGVINLGIEGIMAMGGVMAIITVNDQHTSVWVGLLVAGLVGLGIGIVFAFSTVILKVNQILSGLALTFIGTGMARHIGRPFSQLPVTDTLNPIRLPILGNIPILGDALFDQNVLVYIALFILPVISYVILFKTRHGLAMRAVGQDPAAADASGVRVNALRFFYVSLGSLLAGIAGGYVTLALTKAWSDGVVAGRGWITLSLVFFAGWHPIYVVLGAIFFGATSSLTYVVQVQGWDISPYLLALFPSVATILLLIFSSWLRNRLQPTRPQLRPKALAQPYYRE
jgi:ABC-type uncharacterized transport system permease subunit